MQNIYEKQSFKMRIENVKDVIKNPEAYQKKLLKYSQRHNLEYNFLQQELLDNIYLMNEIAKDPSKQNFQEIIAKDYILENYKEFQNFEILPKKSKNGIESIYLTNGQIVKESDLSTKNHTKSIDFKWEYKGFTIYATHKYTKDSGGGQDNQYKDVVSFLEHAKQNINNKILFVAICDGKYYEGKRSEELKRMVMNTKCVVSTISNLKCDLDSLINFLE